MAGDYEGSRHGDIMARDLWLCQRCLDEGKTQQAETVSQGQATCTRCAKRDE